jgi:hypothetical protein
MLERVNAFTNDERRDSVTYNIVGWHKSRGVGCNQQLLVRVWREVISLMRDEEYE